MLDLNWLGTLTKGGLLLTVVRLLSTAFNWEFGISRQYLHLLELIFELGERRIKRAESENRLEKRPKADNEEEEEEKEEDEFPEEIHWMPPQTSNNSNLGHCQAGQGPTLRRGEKLIDAEKGSADVAANSTQLTSNTNKNNDTPTRANGLELVAGGETGERRARVTGCRLDGGGGGGNGNKLELRGEEENWQIGETNQLNGSRRGPTRFLKSRAGQTERESSSNGLDAANWHCLPSEGGGQSSREVDQQQQQQQQDGAKKMRRISTPDGPPVFLLDDFDDLALQMDNDHQKLREHEFQMDDAVRFVSRGVSAIIDDQVTKRFTTEELKSWNLLTRTNAKNYQFMSRSLGLCWFLGLIFRYFILMPMRILFTLAGFAWLSCTMALVGLLPRRCRDKPYELASLMAFRMLACGITSKLKFHNRQFRAKRGDICVANHTSPIDALLMACDNCYAMVGQRHGGLLGLLERVLSRAANHVWFDRDEMRDRLLVTERLKQHVSKSSNLPVLIFPEGTCINNSAVMMFRKGSFETTDRVCPVAIKYDSRFGDPFWNSSKQSYLQYLLMMMSSWAIKCDVWYLPPMERLANESSAEFANRVKAVIARQGGLVDLAWDGQLKRSSVKPTWRYQQQEDYVKRLKLE